jgi:ketosteroid isomerase-like protein
MSDYNDSLEVAAALSTAFETGDLEAIADLYADDVVVWHNFDQLGRTREQALSSAAWVAAEIEDFTVGDRWAAAVEGGYVQQCVFRGRMRSSGEVLEMPSMLRVHVRDGQVTRIEEYADSGAGGNVPDPD